MKMTRRIILSAIALIAVGLLLGFVTTADSQDDIITIRLGHGQTESNERHIAMLEFEELVEERSDGQMQVEIFPNEILGSEAVMTESVSFNDLEIVAASATTQWGGEISVFELPYLFDSYEQAWSVLDSEIGQKVAEPYQENNLRLLAYFENGFRQITSNQRIETPEDMEGLKIRTPEFPLSIAIFEAFGANPTPMAFGEVYTGLQQGSIEGQENPVSNAYANRFQEVQNYLIMSNHQYMPLHMLMSDDFWNSLNSGNQEIIQSSALEAAQFHRNLVRENENQMVEEMASSGMEIIEPNVEEFRTLVEPVYENFANIYGQDLVDTVVEAAESYGG